MAKEKSPEAAGVQAQKDAVPKKPRFRDTWQGFLVFVGILLALRFLVFEPFKIPTGSMEPTLIGHEDYGDRILPVDVRVAEAWGRLNVPDPLPAVDGLLAATAQVHDLTFVTRNVADVARTGVPCLDPFTP